MADPKKKNKTSTPGSGVYRPDPFGIYDNLKRKLGVTEPAVPSSITGLKEVTGRTVKQPVNIRDINAKLTGDVAKVMDGHVTTTTPSTTGAASSAVSNLTEGLSDPGTILGVVGNVAGAIAAAKGASRPMPTYKLSDEFGQYKRTLSGRTNRQPNYRVAEDQFALETDVLSRALGGGATAGQILAGLGGASDRAFKNRQSIKAQQDAENAAALGQYGAALGQEMGVDMMNFQNQYNQAGASQQAYSQAMMANLQSIPNQFLDAADRRSYEESMSDIRAREQKLNQFGAPTWIPR